MDKGQLVRRVVQRSMTPSLFSAYALGCSRACSLQAPTGVKDPRATEDVELVKRHIFWPVSFEEFQVQKDGFSVNSAKPTSRAIDAFRSLMGGGPPTRFVLPSLSFSRSGTAGEFQWPGGSDGPTPPSP